MTRYAYCPPGSVGDKLMHRKPSPATKAARALSFERAMNAMFCEIGGKPQADGSCGIVWEIPNPYGRFLVGVHGINVFGRFYERPADDVCLRIGLSRHNSKWNSHEFGVRDDGDSWLDAVARQRWRFESLRDGLL